MNIELIQGNCLTESDKIKDGSVDLILTDLPYGTIKVIFWSMKKILQDYTQHKNRYCF